MAENAKNQDLSENRQFTAGAVPMADAGGTVAAQEAQMSGMTERLREGGERAGDAPIRIKKSIAGAYCHAHKHASDFFNKLASASDFVVIRAQNRVEDFKREHPLQLLAVVTGAAFAIGMTVRLWRAGHDA